MPRLTPDLSDLPPVIGLAGYARSGKDTVADYLCQVHGYRKLAFADALRALVEQANPIIYENGFDAPPYRYRDAVDEYGYETAKDLFPEVREVLQRLGDGAREVFGEDVWVNALHYASLSVPRLVIPDVRYFNEVEYVIAERGEVWRITRPGAGPANGHPSETAIDDIAYTHEIRNDGSLTDLFERVEDTAWSSSAIRREARL